MENLLFLGVPILKHIRVLHSERLHGVLALLECNRVNKHTLRTFLRDDCKPTYCFVSMFTKADWKAESKFSFT